MQTLNLNIENAVNIELCACCLFNVFCKLLFIVTLNLAQFFKNALVVREYLELYKLGSILLEALSDTFGKQIGKLRVRLQQPTTISDTVGDVLELIRLVEILEMEHIVLDNLRVQL